jgi:hypothetical protein
MAIVQLRHDTDGRRYYRRRLAAGKTPMERSSTARAIRAGNPRSGCTLTGGTIPGGTPGESESRGVVVSGFRPESVYGM